MLTPGQGLELGPLSKSSCYENTFRQGGEYLGSRLREGVRVINPLRVTLGDRKGAGVGVFSLEGLGLNLIFLLITIE